MNNFEKLSFDNIEVAKGTGVIYEDDICIKVLDTKRNCLAEAKVSELSLNDFTKDWFYSEILEPEMNSFFYELNSEERKIVEHMSIKDYITYINDKYGEEDTSTLNGLYKVYKALKKYYSDDVFKIHSKCAYIKSVNANYEKTGAGTLIVDYLKENYELIFLNSTEECDGYWMDKANFKQIFNDSMYWTENEKLNEIL